MPNNSYIDFTFLTVLGDLYKSLSSSCNIINCCLTPSLSWLIESKILSKWTELGFFFNMYTLGLDLVIILHRALGLIYMFP
jgi:hypothetical protein